MYIIVHNILKSTPEFVLTQLIQFKYILFFLSTPKDTQVTTAQCFQSSILHIRFHFI